MNKLTIEQEQSLIEKIKSILTVPNLNTATLFTKLQPLTLGFACGIYLPKKELLKAIRASENEELKLWWQIAKDFLGEAYFNQADVKTKDKIASANGWIGGDVQETEINIYINEEETDLNKWQKEVEDEIKS